MADSHPFELALCSHQSSEPEELTYCICNDVNKATVVACENAYCPQKWFHPACVDLGVAPKEGETWYCPSCQPQRTSTPQKPTGDSKTSDTPASGAKTKQEQFQLGSQALLPPGSPKSSKITTTGPGSNLNPKSGTSSSSQQPLDGIRRDGNPMILCGWCMVRCRSLPELEKHNEVLHSPARNGITGSPGKSMSSLRQPVDEANQAEWVLRTAIAESNRSRQLLEERMQEARTLEATHQEAHDRRVREAKDLRKRHVQGRITALEEEKAMLKAQSDAMTSLARVIDGIITGLQKQLES